MKTIYKIAKTELRNLFYSPIAWLVLIIFTFQLSLNFTEGFYRMIDNQQYGSTFYGITGNLLGGRTGLFPIVISYLYLYIPLVTMSLMSREIGSGSIKLLYSSPVTNTQIILGKFLSMMIFGLVLIGIIFIYCLICWFTVESFDYPVVFSGLLGVYLLICAYAAIGLFMSSLTSYQVIAAIGTLAIFTIMNYIRGMWQEVPFVRDITYWFAIGGRTGGFTSGLICTEDLIYFIIVIILFLFLTITRLQSIRQKTSWKNNLFKYVGIFLVAIFIGYITSMPTFKHYWDVTATKRNSLSENSQKILSQIDDELTMTTYVNLLDHFLYLATPKNIKGDENRFAQYTRFKPKMKMEYVYYFDEVDNPHLYVHFPGKTMEEKAYLFGEKYNINKKKILRPEEIRKIVDLKPEGNHFVRQIKRANGKTAFIRVYDDAVVHPNESEISAAFKSLVTEMPRVGFVTGHGERNTVNDGDRDYSRFTQDKGYRYSLVNQVIDFEEINLNSPIPDKIDILVIAEMRNALSEKEKDNLNKYIAKGGNAIIVGEPGRQDVMNPVIEEFGLKFTEGMLVQSSESFYADLVISKATKESIKLSKEFQGMMDRKEVITTPGTLGIEVIADKGYKIIPVLKTDSTGVWNELETINFIDDTVKLNTEIGEVEKSYTTAVALSRMIGNKEQKIVVLGDADCISNGELRRSRKGVKASNFYLTTGLFYWLTDNEVPIDVSRPALKDNKIDLTASGGKIVKNFFNFIYPSLFLILYLVIWFRRRGW